MPQQPGINQANQRYLTIGLAATAAVGAGALLYYNASRWGLSRSRAVTTLVRKSVKGKTSSLISQDRYETWIEQGVLPTRFAAIKSSPWC